MKKSNRSPLFSVLRRAFALAMQAEKANKSTAAYLEQCRAQADSRRRFLRRAGTLALGSAIIPGILPAMSGLSRRYGGRGAPNIAIIGGGVAGLNALHQLKKHGLQATVYEASDRTGGRMFTVQEAMGPGTWTEFGGEFVDTSHADIWALAGEFGLELIDYAQASELELEQEAFYFEGRHRSLEEVVTGFRRFAARLQEDMDRLSDDISYTCKDPFTIQMDRSNLSEYLENIGADGWIKSLIEAAYEAEYGLSTEMQSALNLLLLISTDTSDGRLAFFGDSDERYKVRGGNQRITDALTSRYEDHIRYGASLESIRPRNRSYELYFSGKNKAVPADFVIMALPFTRLRQVDMRLDMPRVKRQCIDTLSYGTNAKLMLGMQSHFWRKQGFTGLVYSDNGVTNGWDNAQLQTPDDAAAGLSILFGGRQGVELGQGSVASQKNKYLPLWNDIYPGATAHFNGKMARMHWPSHPYTLGSYTCYTPGQYTGISGAEQMPVGKIFFAGEHCGGEFSGFMNGAAKSGREAAEAIIATLD